ncbi:hypothetical protein B5G09_04105 [Alistipes sp. An54]|uniref:tyrosine-type recombinase/integrase n=1 Tax=Alistipes sp. An54 TaxID=1965645 RepID=UPI000B39F821|nr:hypothetical protein B5G09_04105 [Alistipes sp. An54]
MLNTNHLSFIYSFLLLLAFLLLMHSSRHTCATLLLNSGVDIYTVKEILGHTDIGTTMKYTKVIDKTKRIAVNKIPNLYSTKEESEGVSM